MTAQYFLPSSNQFAREVQVVGLVLFTRFEDGQPLDIIKTFLARRFINAEVAHVFEAIGTPGGCVAKLRSYHDAGLTVPLIFAEGCRLELAFQAGAAYARE